jgi:ADP-ribose pyrophosphatase YjhB (NUDIX family)
MLDSIVIACVDIAITNDRGQLLLGKRTRHPQADWWIVGGRMQTGEHFSDSAKRLVKKELGLEITPERFSYLTTFSAAWNKRAFPPEDNGTHTLSIVLTTKLSEAEIAAIVPNDEYSSMQWVDTEEVANEQSGYHPAVRQCANALNS